MINSEDKADIKVKMGAKIANSAVKASDDSHPDWATAKKQPKDWKGDSKSDWKKYKQSRPENNPKKEFDTNEKKEKMASKLSKNTDKLRKEGKLYKPENKERNDFNLVTHIGNKKIK